jgi:hypothetical protein
MAKGGPFISPNPSNHRPEWSLHQTLERLPSHGENLQGPQDSRHEWDGSRAAALTWAWRCQYLCQKAHS